MAGLDPSIIMGAQPVQMQNPLDMATKALTLRDLSQKSQLQGLQTQQAQQDFNDQQVMRNAYSNNTKIGPDGTPTIDQQGILSDVAKQSPHLVPQIQQKIAEQKSNVLQNQMKQNDMSIQLLQGANDQPSWDSAIQKAQQMGLPVDQIPKQFDPQQKQMLLGRALSTKDYLSNQVANQEVGVKQSELGIKQQDLDLSRMRYNEGKQTEAFKDLMSHAESSRQLPDVKQAYLDRYNAQKVQDLFSGDPNKLSSNMVNLGVSEVAKIAQGGTPTQEEFKNLSPQNAQMIMARTKQYLTSHPEASQQGAFVNVLKDYATMIQGNANKVISSNLGTLGESYKDHLKDSDYQNFQNNFIKGNPYSMKQTSDSMSGKSDQSQPSQKTDYSIAGIKGMPVGTVLNGQTKTKDGWVPLDASK